MQDGSEDRRPCGGGDRGRCDVEMEVEEREIRQ